LRDFINGQKKDGKSKDCFAIRTLGGVNAELRDFIGGQKTDGKSKDCFAIRTLGGVNAELRDFIDGQKKDGKSKDCFAIRTLGGVNAELRDFINGQKKKQKLHQRRVLCEFANIAAHMSATPRRIALYAAPSVCPRPPPLPRAVLSPMRIPSRRGLPT
jgi:hypothetical protein